MLRFLCSFVPSVALGLFQPSCNLEPAFECTAWCLSDSIDDGEVQHEVSDVIHASDLGAAVTTCETWLTCNAGPSDETRCLCTEMR